MALRFSPSYMPRDTHEGTLTKGTAGTRPLQSREETCRVRLDSSRNMLQVWDPGLQ